MFFLLGVIKVNFYNDVSLLKLKSFNENREMDVPILHTFPCM